MLNQFVNWILPRIAPPQVLKTMSTARDSTMPRFFGLIRFPGDPNGDVAVEISQNEKKVYVDFAIVLISIWRVNEGLEWSMTLGFCPLPSAQNENSTRRKSH